MEYKTLNNGLRMPMVGLGVYDVSERETQRVVEDAISVGYRSIDTAAMYYNERGVGDAVRACGVAREELFITTKICDSCYSRDETMRSVDHSMRQLGLDYVDLMLIHWPVGKPAVMWHALEELYEQGLFKAIGVSNFYPNTFPMIVKGAKVMPVVNQCETHVLYQQRKMMEYLQPYNVVLEAWSPLAEGKHGIFKNPVLKRVGEKYGKTAAQIALKFLIQSGIIIIPKTTHKERMIENINLFDFTLADDDLSEIRCKRKIGIFAILCDINRDYCMIILKDILLVGVGSFFGGIARYLISLAMKGMGSAFPWATMTANIVGCLLIGLLWAAFNRVNASSQLNLLLIVGFCGGFTTFSTFSKESLCLLQAGNYSTFILYALGSVVLGIVAVALGYYTLAK